jgi:uncharacterized protein (DUF427 family)
MSSNPAPGFIKNPSHCVHISSFQGRVVIRICGEVIADTRDAFRVEESGYDPVYYIPRRDILMGLVKRSEQLTTCPYKGNASYYSFSVGSSCTENVAWSYETPYDEVGKIAGYLAFYANRVDLLVLP